MKDEANKTIAQKVAAVSGELLAIPKVKHKESTVQYAFRSIDDVMNALNYIRRSKKKRYFLPSVGAQVKN